MVERRTPEREVGGSILTQVSFVVSFSKIHLPPKSTGNTQEAVSPSRHDRKIVDWDIKPQPNQTNLFQFIFLYLKCRYLHLYSPTL